ncbi:hypothetical protein VTN49DRAFT_5176 [Thermomyces lanuginosus]|uniref:uncharacterized protein n=1 Tax=Thermomyces lanuginosus TaxID=5541 RepID=UPI003742B92A
MTMMQGFKNHDYYYRAFSSFNLPRRLARDFFAGSEVTSNSSCALYRRRYRNQQRVPGGTFIIYYPMAMSPKPSRNDINASSSRDTEPPPPPPPHPSSMTDARNLIEDYSRIMLRYTQQQFDAFAVHGNGNSFGGKQRQGQWEWYW